MDWLAPLAASGNLHPGLPLPGWRLRRVVATDRHRWDCSIGADFRLVLPAALNVLVLSASALATSLTSTRHRKNAIIQQLMRPRARTKSNLDRRRPRAPRRERCWGEATFPGQRVARRNSEDLARVDVTDLMLAEMNEPFEIFLDYEIPTASSVQLADAKELAEMIKTASWPSMLLRRYETVKIEPGKVTILLSERPVANWVINGIKEVTQKWMKQRGHRQVRVRVEGAEAEIPFTA